MATLQNTVIKGTDTPVVISFEWEGEFLADGLSNFTDIQVEIGDEEYTLLLNPSEVVVASNSELRILLGLATSLAAGSYRLIITGISLTYDDGYVLSGGCRNPLTVRVKDPL